MVVLSLAPLFAWAQTAKFYDFYDKYAGRDGYTTVEISGAMLKVMNASSDDNKTVKKDAGDKSAMDNIKNLIIIISEDRNAGFMGDVRKLTRGNEYTPLTVIRDGGDTVELLVRQKGDAAVELLMIVTDMESTVVMSITGDNLNIDKISQMAASGGIF